jgi:hypothetical protein
MFRQFAIFRCFDTLNVLTYIKMYNYIVVGCMDPYLQMRGKMVDDTY